MNFDDIKTLQSRQTDLDVPFIITKRRQIRNYYSVNDFIAIPVENTASFFNRDVDLPLKKNDGTEIGYLFFTKHEIVQNIFSLSEPKYVCLLNDILDSKIFENKIIYTFQSDYVIIYRDYIVEYLDHYMTSAPLWGFFNHKYPSLVINPPLKKVLTEIQVGSFTKFSKEYYFEASVRGIKNSLAFERFLKYYHLLELNFDFDVIDRIKNLDIIADSKSISKLLNEYEKPDIERLKYLFTTYCTNTNAIIDKMNAVSGFLGTAKEIFYDFGKDSNPLKEFSKFNAVVIKADGFSLTNCKTAKINNANNADEHKKFIGNLCTYWIYRVRNSIAHNKVGEYIMSYKDERFLVEFAEPLLLEFLKQMFK